MTSLGSRSSPNFLVATTAVGGLRGTDRTVLPELNCQLRSKFVVNHTANIVIPSSSYQCHHLTQLHLMGDQVESRTPTTR